MASAEEKLKDESKDRQVMGSKANGADGAEGKVEENNPSKDQIIERYHCRQYDTTRSDRAIIW